MLIQRTASENSNFKHGFFDLLKNRLVFVFLRFKAKQKNNWEFKIFQITEIFFRKFSASFPSKAASKFLVL